MAATYATNNEQAGKLLGQYVKATMGSKTPQIVTMDLDPSASVGIQRHNGFLEGMGLPLTDARAGHRQRADPGRPDQGAAAMENLLQRVGGKVNVVYNDQRAGRAAAPTRR